ncbi:SMI1/KNR4 family protein [Streptomyces sp. NPDC086091]|uniref:SMI1/KNR4 family protein n=1 Tax=unclassified Streptomyces TaxID=2593676 RepID=UPI003822DF71
MTETITDDRRFPPALADLAEVALSYEDGIDFEPYEAFDAPEETTDWIRSWTGNDTLDGGAYRVFGQDGTGGLAALWCVRPGLPLAAQPVVFLGSEGECGAVAGNLSDFLWVLAEGAGPKEVVEYPGLDTRPHAALTALAERHAGTPRRPAAEIVAEARREFATFRDDLYALCR